MEVMSGCTLREEKVALEMKTVSTGVVGPAVVALCDSAASVRQVGLGISNREGKGEVSGRTADKSLLWRVLDLWVLCFVCVLFSRGNVACDMRVSTGALDPSVVFGASMVPEEGGVGE